MSTHGGRLWPAAEAYHKKLPKTRKAAEEIALGDAKVIEADTKVAAVLQDDATSQRKIDTVVLAQHELRAPFRISAGPNSVEAVKWIIISRRL